MPSATRRTIAQLRLELEQERRRVARLEHGDGMIVDSIHKLAARIEALEAVVYHNPSFAAGRDLGRQAITIDADKHPASERVRRESCISNG